ncbi:hypothetical protein MZO42_16935 [Sphingomonas psychrotolerans]|uniref:Uncharacterized protein n=1 Tax=Sphingomonas psychrotolerans TaxID=1327635 RepID=A0ABU3N940_9SPHN|nr:hypothetical protein [Sphingomonas psychrotolerans]MDT8760389.1 hypothetical protein [Sphingomonas psychrotolerans]
MLFFLLLTFADPCTPLRGGPAQGMCAVPGTMSGSHLAVVELLPAREAGQPMSAPLAASLARALEAYDRGRDLPADLRTAEATSRFCAEWGDACTVDRPLVRWEVPKRLVHNRPYLLDDGGSESNGCAAASSRC